MPEASTCSDSIKVIETDLVQIDDDDKDNQDRGNNYSLAPGLQRALTAQSLAQILHLLSPRKKFSIDMTILVLEELRHSG